MIEPWGVDLSGSFIKNSVHEFEGTGQWPQPRKV